MSRSIETVILKLSDDSQHRILRPRIKHSLGRLGSTGSGRAAAKNDCTTVCSKKESNSLGFLIDSKKIDRGAVRTGSFASWDNKNA